MNILFLLSTLKLVVVLSASMGRALPVGSLALAAPQQEYFVGDVVTFAVPNSDELLTHRVESVNPEVDASHRYGASSINGINGSKIYKTQGDANNVADDWELTSEDIVGKVIFHLPYLGYLLHLPQILLTAILPNP